jgi:hypothetical protein
MARTLPTRVGIPLQTDEANQLLDLASKIPMTTHSTIAKVAMLYGLHQLTANPELVENLIATGLARRPGRGRPRKITGPEEYRSHPRAALSESNEIDPDSISRPGHRAKKP